MKKNIQSEYEIYKDSLNEENKKLLTDYFEDLEQHVRINRVEHEALFKDFENAFLYYDRNHIKIEEAIERLNCKNLGGFYTRPAKRWFPLDDAAKIYPLSMRRNNMAVFRISVYLKQDIIPEILQIALNFTIKRFPSFATTLKKGFFWHYLDSTVKHFVVKKEYKIPCAPLKIGHSGSKAFRVVYFNNRISLEVFHALTDGTGGLVFIKTLLATYLTLLGMEKLDKQYDEILNINDAPHNSETCNEFPKYAKKGKTSGLMNKRAIQMTGKLSRIKPCQILHFEIDTDKLKLAAKQKQATISTYILALIFVACKYSCDTDKGNIQIQVPVNMRQFYESNSIRNFSMYCVISLPINTITNVDDIIKEIEKQLKEKSTKEAMSEMINSTSRLVRALRFIPLFIKGFVASLVFGFLGDKVFSNTLSNLGLVKLPPQMEKYVEKIDFILSAGLTNRAGCTIISCNNKSVISITKSTSDPSFEEKIYELLKSAGLKPVAKGSALVEN